MIEAAADASDALTDRYLESGTLSDEDIVAGLRARTLDGEIFPMLCGSALKNKGVQAVLDAVIGFLPSPLDVPPMTGFGEGGCTDQRRADDGAPFSALAFKVQSDPIAGRLVFFRVYSGAVATGDSVFNPAKGLMESVGSIMQMHANEREEVEGVFAGDIAASVGLNGAFTGDTLCSPDDVITFERMSFPEPVMHVSLEPRTQVDQERMALALGRITQEDPTFRSRIDAESGQTIISGMGELHLEIAVERLRREYGVSARAGVPQVAYREGIRSSVECSGDFHSSIGDRTHFGHVRLKLEQVEHGRSLEFVDGTRDGMLAREYIPAVKQGLGEALANGVLAGFPVSGVKVTLLDGSRHGAESSDSAFRLAASIAFKDGMRRACPVLLEPMMAVKVETPQEFTGSVMGDLHARRGMIQGIDDPTSGIKAIHAEVPLAEMFGYSTSLRSATQGRATYSMEFKQYSEAPEHVAEAVINKN
jgi:elongation factor G